MSYSRKNKRSRKLKGGEAHSAIFSPLVKTISSGGDRQPSVKTVAGGKLRAQKGGVSFPMSFANVPIRSFYPQNNFNNDPGYLTVASRNAGSFYGGKRSRRRTNKNKSKKQRGGSWFSPNQFPTIPKIPAVNLYDASNPPKE